MTAADPAQQVCRESGLGMHGRTKEMPAAWEPLWRAGRQGLLSTQKQEGQDADSTAVAPSSRQMGSSPVARYRADSCCALLTGRSAQVPCRGQDSGQPCCREAVPTMQGRQTGIVLPMKQ